MSQVTLEMIFNELRNFRSEVNQEFGAVRSEFDQKFEAIRSEFKAEIQSVKKDQQTILTRLNSHEKMYAQLIGMVKSVKETVADIASQQDTMERKFTFQFNTHAASIEVLNREQLMIKTELEMLKNRY